MKLRSTIILSLVALGLLAYIVVYERHTVSSGEAELRQGRLLPRLIRDKVEKIEIQRASGKVVLERKKNGDGVDAWSLSSPIKDAADLDAIESLLSAVEWADARRTLDGISDSDRAKFGLTKPRVRATFFVLGEQLVVTVGGEDPKGQGAYVSLKDDDKAYVVGKDFAEALDVGADVLRNKEVLKHVDAEGATRIDIHPAESPEAYVLSKKNGRWWIDKPVQGYASARSVENLVGSFLTFRATRYVEDNPKDLAKYGLAHPVVTVGVTSPKGAVTLAVGGPCEGHVTKDEPSEVYVRVDKGAVLCAGEKDARAFVLQKDAIREDRMVVADEARVDGVRIEAGKAVLHVTRNGDRWKYDAGDDQGDADATSVSEFVRALKFPTVLEYDGAADSKSQVKVTLELAEKTTETVALVKADDAAAWVKRGDEPRAVRFPADVARLFSASKTRFLSRHLLDEKALDATAATRTRAGSHEEATHEGGIWNLAGVKLVDMEGGTIATTVEAVTNLTASEFIADSPTASHGLDKPRLSFEVRYQSSDEDDIAAEEILEPTADGGVVTKPAPKDKRPAVRSYVIRFGADAPSDMVYAEVDHGPVFTVSKALLDQLTKPWKRTTK